MAADVFSGFTFISMSDALLIENFDRLCVLSENPNGPVEDFLRWIKAKEEILRRMKSSQEAA